MASHNFVDVTGYYGARSTLAIRVLMLCTQLENVTVKGMLVPLMGQYQTDRQADRQTDRLHSVWLSLAGLENRYYGLARTEK